MNETGREALCASLFLVVLLAWPLSIRAGEGVLGVEWVSRAQLEELSSSALPLRYIAARVALVGGGVEERKWLEKRAFRVLFADRAAPGEEYFLSDHAHAEWPRGVEVVYEGGGWSLLRAGPDSLPEAEFLYALPERFSPRGWLQGGASPRRAQQGSSPAVAGLLDQVRAEDLRAHVEALSLIDPSLGSVAGNVRTRFAVHPQTFESTRYIRDRLAEYLGAAAVEIQPFGISPRRVSSHVARGGEATPPEDTTAYNVVGALPGTDPQAGYYVICAHYDATGVRSRGWDWRVDPAPGADDNATGVALVLEAARVLAGQSFPWSIRFIAFSGEELGLLGSQEYVGGVVVRDERVLGVLNFDMIGFNDLAQRLELVTNPGSRWLVEAMRQVNERYAIGLDVDVLEDDAARLSDHAPFWARGFDAILGIENYLPTDPSTHGVVEGEYRVNSQYHSVLDLPDSLNWELVARTTRLAVGTLAQYGLETGLPNLAVFAGDLSGDPGDDLRVRVSNIGLGRLEQPFALRVWRCASDSTECDLVHESEQPGGLAPGAVEDVVVPWQRFGEMVFLVEVDPDDRVAESRENDNRAFQQVRLVSQRGIAVFPNPFRPAQDRFLSFSGVPLRARVQVFGPGGELVWSQDEERQGELTREIRWFGQNLAGFAVGSGVYMYVVRSEAGEVLRRGKVAVLR